MLHSSQCKLTSPDTWCYHSIITCDIRPGDFATKVKQINSQSDLIYMSRFAGQSYLTTTSSIYIILIWDPYIFNLHNLWQTWCNYIHRKPNQYALHFNEQITRTHFFLLQPSIIPVPAQVILLWKGPPELCIECQLVPVWAFPPKSPGTIDEVNGYVWRGNVGVITGCIVTTCFFPNFAGLVIYCFLSIFWSANANCGVICFLVILFLHAV